MDCIRKKPQQFGQGLNSLQDKTAVYKSCRWYQMALWSEGVTNTDIQLQVFFSLHSVSRANHMGILQVKILALSKKWKGISRLTGYFLSFPHLPSPPFERAAGTTSFPPALARELGSPTPLPHPELIPLNKCLALCLLSPFKGLSQNTFIAPAIFCLIAGALKSSESVLFNPVNIQFFYIIFFCQALECASSRKSIT